MIPEAMDEPGLSRFKASLPMAGEDGEGKFYHLMDLPGFGLLVLVKGGVDFDFPVIQSLKPLNEKLARACIACLQNEKIARMNRPPGRVTNYTSFTEGSIGETRRKKDQRRVFLATKRRCHARMVSGVTNVGSSRNAANPMALPSTESSRRSPSVNFSRPVPTSRR